METYDPHKTSNEVRQGSSRLDNFWVLIISTVVAAAILGIILLIYSMGATPATALPFQG